MRELAQHITDLVENAARAGARRVDVEILEDLVDDRLIIVVADDGHGMDPETVARLGDPFFTSRTCRRVGLGIPLVAATAERCDGSVQVESSPGRGTRVTVGLRHSHIDRPPLGNLQATLLTALVGHPEVDLCYRHRANGRGFDIDGGAIRRELGEVPLSHPSVLRWLEQYLTEGLSEVGVMATPDKEGNYA